MYRRYYQGFSLVEIMIIMAIIGIVKVIAIPTYKEYLAHVEGAAAMKGVTGHALGLQMFVQNNNRCDELNQSVIETTALQAIPPIIMPYTPAKLIYNVGNCQVSLSISAIGTLNYQATSIDSNEEKIAACRKGAGLQR